MKISILGHHVTKFGELWDQSLTDLFHQAVTNAISNSGLKSDEIDAIFVSNMSGGQYDNQLHLGALVSQMVGGNPPAMRVEGACASGGLALMAAQQSIISGQYKNVLVVGAEKMNDADSSLTTKYLAGAANYSTEFGSTFPGLYAILAQAHMNEFGTTRDQLSAVAAKNHLHGFDNPQAQYHKKFTIEQINMSIPVADPLRLLDCSPVTDGAAAIVLSGNDVKGKAQIIGRGQGQDSLDLAGRKNLTELNATKKAAKQAYQSAKVKAGDIEVAEVHDCFTIAEILATEDLGFFKKGEGGDAAIKGKTTYGGEVVINPSGGLKASGHPIGATGIKQVAYLAKLLEHGKFKLALAHNVGGSGATAVVNILKIDK